MTIDRKFSDSTTISFENNLSKQFLVAFMRNVIGRYFWGPYRFSDSLRITRIEGFSVPIWRLIGKASATWTGWTLKKETIKTEDDKYIEKESWDSEGRSATFTLDWAISAHRPISGPLRIISEAIETVNSEELLVKVDWKGHFWGDFFEQVWPGRYGGIINKIKEFIPGFWKPRHIGNASVFIKPQEMLSSNDLRYRQRWLQQLRPELPLRDAKAQVEGLIKQHIIKEVSKGYKKVDLFDPFILLNKEEQYWIPVWFIEYEYLGEKYHAVISGYNAQPISVVIPLSAKAGLIALSIPNLVVTIFAVALLFITNWNFSFPNINLILVFFLIANLPAFTFYFWLLSWLWKHLLGR